jgi:hypothetical protein
VPRPQHDIVAEFPLQTDLAIFYGEAYLFALVDYRNRWKQRRSVSFWMYRDGSATELFRKGRGVDNHSAGLEGFRDDWLGGAGDGRRNATAALPMGWWYEYSFKVPRSFMQHNS